MEGEVRSNGAAAGATTTVEEETVVRAELRAIDGGAAVEVSRRIRDLLNCIHSTPPLMAVSTTRAVVFFSSFESTSAGIAPGAAAERGAEAAERAAAAAGEVMMEVRAYRGGGVLIGSPLRFRLRLGMAAAGAATAAAATAGAAAATGTAAARGARAGPGITVVGSRLLSLGAGVGKRKEMRSMRGCC